jgi:diguanylate cyclase (GGDEF)-like protein
METLQGIDPNHIPTALVVSTDTGYSNNLRRSLFGAGFDAVVTPSHSEALQLMAESNVDVAIVDYDLPECDGIAFFEQIRGRYGRDAPPVMVLGDHYSPTLLARCLSAGTAGLHVKSDRVEELIARATELIRDRDKRRAIEESGSLRQLNGDMDPLTGVPGDAYFNRRLLGESMTSYRDNTALGLLLIVPDRFEQLAEGHGRVRADEVLRSAARIIQSELRSRDCVARYGDNSFGVILPETPLSAATAVGRRLRRVLAATEFGNLENALSVTFSIGVAARAPGAHVAPEDLYTQALNGCNGAEAMGGDRVVTDNALTGAPLILVVGAHEHTRSLVAGFSGDNVDVRSLLTVVEAKRSVEEIPVGMIVNVLEPSGDGEELELFSWIRDRYPAIRRVLAAGRVDASLMARAVNNGAIDYFLPLPVDAAELQRLAEQLLFS